MIADILGRKITLIDVPEASLRGVTLLALEGIANIKKTEEFSTVRGKVFEPNLAKNHVFIEEMKKHKTFYDLVNGKY